MLIEAYIAALCGFLGGCAGILLYCKLPKIVDRLLDNLLLVLAVCSIVMLMRTFPFTH